MECEVPVLKNKKYDILQFRRNVSKTPNTYLPISYFFLNLIFTSLSHVNTWPNVITSNYEVYILLNA